MGNYYNSYSIVHSYVAIDLRETRTQTRYTAIMLAAESGNEPLCLKLVAWGASAASLERLMYPFDSKCTKAVMRFLENRRKRRIAMVRFRKARVVSSVERGGQ